MKPLLLAFVLTCAMETTCQADQLYWVVGNHATAKCEIVTSNPVVTGDPLWGTGGNIWMSDGPYTSRSDAKLARSTISGCPITIDPEEDSGAGSTVGSR